MNDQTHNQIHTEALEAALDALRREALALRASHPAQAAQLDPLIAELERRIHNNNTADLQEDLRSRVQATIREFAAEHPGPTAALTQVLGVLGGTGI